MQRMPQLRIRARGQFPHRLHRLSLLLLINRSLDWQEAGVRGILRRLNAEQTVPEIREAVCGGQNVK